MSAGPESMLQKGSIHAPVYIPYLILDGRQNFAGQLIAVPSGQRIWGLYKVQWGGTDGGGTGKEAH